MTTTREIPRPLVAPEQWRQYRAGARTALPMVAGSIVFGLAFGAAISASVVGPVAGALSSAMMFAGAAQLAMVDQMNAGTPAVMVIVTGLVISARYALFSATLAPTLARFPRRWRFGLAFMLSDIVSVLCLKRTVEETDPVRQRWYFLGVGTMFAGFNITGTIVGVMLGAHLPTSWQMQFVVPLILIAVVVPVVRDAPAVVASAVALTVMVVGRDLPNGSTIVVAALVGIAAGWFVPERTHDPCGEATQALEPESTP
jgi:4-azaleucine resistance transporter AzlC